MSGSFPVISAECGVTFALEQPRDVEVVIKDAKLGAALRWG